MSYETPQMFRYREPGAPPNMPALAIFFVEEPQVNAKATADTGIQTYDNVLIAYVAPMGQPKSNAACEIERTLPDGKVIVNREYAFKYAEQVKLYKAGATSEGQGTPLKDLIGMTPALALNLRSVGIHTVEMLAETADGASNSVMGFWDWRDKARKHVELREKNAPMLKLEAIEEKHKTEVASLTRQLEELKAAMEANGVETKAPKVKKAA